MDSETKQELLTIALLMKKTRMQEEVDRKEEMDKTRILFRPWDM